MNQNKILWHVDAFTNQPFKGNPAGVCILEKEMPDVWMQNIAAEMNLSETAFIIQDDKKFRIRFFSPMAEVPLCGHASLSSAHVLFETGIAKPEDTINFISKAGSLAAMYDNGWIILDFPAYLLKPVKVPEEIEKILGKRPVEFLLSSNGWSFALLSSEKEVTELSPDFILMKNSRYNDMIVTAPSSDMNYDFCVRCFAPALGINEDPVTGSAHCVLAPYWSERTGKTKFTSHQVSKREGILKVELKGNRVEISGQAKTILKSELFV